jgi:hypothetical protein
MLLLVKSGKRLVGDREKINIFGNEYFVTVNQSVYFFVLMTSTYGQCNLVSAAFTSAALFRKSRYCTQGLESRNSEILPLWKGKLKIEKVKSIRLS